MVSKKYIFENGKHTPQNIQFALLWLLGAIQKLRNVKGEGGWKNVTEREGDDEAFNAYLLNK